MIIMVAIGFSNLLSEEPLEAIFWAICGLIAVSL
jgi:hypothetical protein